MQVQHEQDHDHADQGQARLEQRGQAVLDELVERLDVVGQPRDDHARAVARVEADRQPLQVREQLARAGPAARAGRPSRRGRSARRWRRRRSTAESRKAATIRSSAPMSWRRMPSSIASLASGAGRERRRGGHQQRDEHRGHPPAVRTPAAPRARAACGRGPRSPAGGGEVRPRRPHSPAASAPSRRSIGLRLMKTWSGMPFSTISRYSCELSSSSAWVPSRGDPPVLEHDDPVAPARSSRGGGRSRTWCGLPSPRGARP